MTSTNCAGAKYATARNPHNPTFGARVAAVAEYLGGSFMPWQRYVSDVAMELDRDRPGEFRYPVVVVTVPRQAGKSYWLRAVMADRVLSYNRHEILMTAQTGKDAKKRWNQLVQALDAKKKTAFKVRESQGSEALTYIKRGSYIAPFAPTPKSLHGDSLHLVTIDEAWAFDLVSGAALEAAINPTQLTITGGQIIIVSTRGTAQSAYLNALIDKGRAAVSAPESRLAYFEWSADEELAKADPYSDETLSFHPAIGHTQTAAKIRELATGSVSNYRRAYLNLPPLTESGLIDTAIWDSLAAEAPATIPDPARVSLTFDTTKDGIAGAIVAAWTDDDKSLNLAVVKAGSGTGWIAPAMKAAFESGYATIGADDTGPRRTIIADLIDADVPVRALRAREFSTGCQTILSAITSGLLSHDDHKLWVPQWEIVATKPLAGATAFSEDKSDGAIDVLRAAASAAYLARFEPPRGLQVF